MIRFLALFGFVFGGFSVAANADNMSNAARPVVVELFASQNCPACPKAHRTLRDVANTNDDVLVLTWSVDYWDYLGEADSMAMPEAKARQAAYAERMSVRAPYTPQSIYDGVKQCPATRRKQVDKNIEGLREAKSAGDPYLMQVGTQVRVEGTCDVPLEVALIEYLSEDAHETGMVNPVIRTESLGICDDTETGARFDVACKAQCAVLLQEPAYGRVISSLIFK